MKEADICLIVEGAYPFVTGGVASWCHRLISWYEKDYTFHLVTLTAGPKSKKDFKYSLPSNVVSFSSFDISDYSNFIKARPAGKLEQEELKVIERLMAGGFAKRFGQQELGLFQQFLKQGERLFKKYLISEPSFSLMTRIYAKKRPIVGFTKYFYNWRNIHMIMWRVFLLLKHIPPARIYHAPSTGFAGFLACMVALLNRGTSIITEHGIYLQEREIEMKDASWLDEPYLRDMWLDFFRALTKWQYLTVDRLITLYQGNTQLQIAYGAPPEKPEVVPNGIQVEKFIPARRKRLTDDFPVIGMVGRVEPVKDVKTFIQVVKYLAYEFPQLKAYVVGPVDDEDYNLECLRLVETLNLKDNIVFTGPADVVQYYRKFDLLLLTSIKEAMPLVVMEAMASGLPVVATRVGACKELVYGANDGLGRAGLVATPANSQDIGEKAYLILKDPLEANNMAAVGIRRVETLYREQLIIKIYREIYAKGMQTRGQAFTSGGISQGQAHWTAL